MMTRTIRPLTRLAALVLTVMLAAPTLARDVVSVDEFLQALEQVRANLQEGEPRELDRDDWKEFDKIHGKFRKILGEVDTIEDLPPRKQTEVFNLQEELDTLLVGRKEEQVVCTERRQLGSRIARRDCITVGERRVLRDRAMQILGDIPSVMTAPSGS